MVNKFQQISSSLSYKPDSEIVNKFLQINNKFAYQVPTVEPILENVPSPPAIHPQTLNKIQRLVDKFKFDQTTQDPIPLKNETNKVQPKIQVFSQNNFLSLDNLK